MAHTLDIALSMDGEGIPPREFRIFPAGEVDTRKGKYLFDEKAAGNVMSAFAGWGLDQLSLDYEHSAMSGGTRDGAAPAAGWFTPAVRNGELWATNVEWTPTAMGYLKERAYRFISPAFTTEAKGNRVLELMNVALTNLPATRRMEPIVASVTKEPQKEEQQMESLIVALGLKPGVSEGEAVAFAKATLERLSAVEKENAAMKVTLAALEKEQAVVKVAALISEAEKAGKITPALRPAVVKLSETSTFEVLSTFVAGLPVQVAAKVPATEPKTDKAPTVMTAEDLAVAKLMGVKPDALAKAKAERSKDPVLSTMVGDGAKKEEEK